MKIALQTLASKPTHSERKGDNKVIWEPLPLLLRIMSVQHRVKMIEERIVSPIGANCRAYSHTSQNAHPLEVQTSNSASSTTNPCKKFKKVIYFSPIYSSPVDSLAMSEDQLKDKRDKRN